MIMADVFKIVFLVLGALLVLVAYWLAAAALFPTWTSRARGAYDAHPARVSLVGAGVSAPLTLLGIAMASNSPNAALKVVGALVVSVPILLALGGSSGFALRIGAGLAMPDDERTPWRRVLRGGVVLSLTFLLPVVGWFVVFPWVLVSGVGAACMATRSSVRLTSTAPEHAG
jgi:hypothetical protein